MEIVQRNLKYIRKRLAITQSELALWAGAKQSTLSNWENGYSDPDAKGLIAFYQCTGISIDILLNVDMEQGKVIADEDVEHFKQTGKVIGKAMGKVVIAKTAEYSHSQETKTFANERDETSTWAVLKLLKEMDGKLDVVRDAVIKGASKKK